MNRLIHLLLLAGLVGCATPYYPVYVSGEGDYYIAQRASAAPYYATDIMLIDGVGIYPWWVATYPPQTFVYYSPYFYPYRFSVWYPPYHSTFYRPYYGFHGWYDPYWCPPYRTRHFYARRDDETPSDSRVVLPVAYSATPVSGPSVWRYENRADIVRRSPNQKSAAYGVAPGTRSAPVYSRTSPSSSSSSASSWRSAGSSRSLGSTASQRGGTARSRGSSTLHRQ